jgi:hypothetical protein
MSDMGVNYEQTLEILREVWRSQGQSAAGLDDSGCEKSCKRMTDAVVGYEDFGDGHDGDLTAAWRDRLEREGKLSHASGSVRDLVLGSPERR